MYVFNCLNNCGKKAWGLRYFCSIKCEEEHCKKMNEHYKLKYASSEIKTSDGIKQGGKNCGSNK